LVLGRRPLGAILHSSNEPGELSQWLCHDDSTIKIVVLIIIIIIIDASVDVYSLQRQTKINVGKYTPCPERRTDSILAVISTNLDNFSYFLHELSPQAARD